MIYLTALTFLLVGYFMGRVQHDPELPQRMGRTIKRTVERPKLGGVKRQPVDTLRRRNNPTAQGEYEAMTETLEELS